VLLHFNYQIRKKKLFNKKRSVFAMIPLLTSLEIFEEATMKKLRMKSKYLTSYLEILLNDINSEKKHFKIITPLNPGFFYI
jgi:kynureninase